MAWVKAETDRSAKVLMSDPRFATLGAMSLKLSQSPQRLPYPVFHDGVIYNTWQDEQHVRGILRRTSVEDFATEQPHWQTVLDYDALAKQDNQKWVTKGLTCLSPRNMACLVELSAGGEDAETMREFDLQSGRFVENGFVLPHSKQLVSWVDKDSLLVARDWGTGTMTASGYPFVVKLLKRGEALASAKEIYRGSATDILVNSVVLHDGDGNQAILIDRMLTFFQHQITLWTPAGAHTLALPPKVELEGLLAGRLIVMIQEDWQPKGLRSALRQGSVVSLDLQALEKNSADLEPTVVFAPTNLEFAQQVALTREHLLLTTLEHVQGRAYIYRPKPDGTWGRTKLNLPDNLSVNIETTDRAGDRFFLIASGFLTPPSLLLGNAAEGALKAAKIQPALFDAKDLLVEQLEATSNDGTRIPYFVARRKDLKYNGQNPTLLEAYGGFQVSYTPGYSATLGQLWLDRGGVYVLANIRGGGEFGPAWHEAGLMTHRQRIYDDFAAVGQDLVDRKITSPRRLGIRGGSNGGLLMGVEMTQHPAMWNALIIEVPLLDMMRFEQIAAGASWVAEFGTVSVPDQRAFLASISPYNQLKPDVHYPEPFIFTTTKDDRVGAAHARKFAALMEQFHDPFFYDEITEGGHGLGANLEESARSEAEEYTYLSRKLID